MALALEGDGMYARIGRRIDPADSVGRLCFVRYRASRFRVKRQDGAARSAPRHCQKTRLKWV